MEGLRNSLEREGIILPGRLAVPHQVGACWVESQGSLGLQSADVAVVPPGQEEGDLLTYYVNYVTMSLSDLLLLVELYGGVH